MSKQTKTARKKAAKRSTRAGISRVRMPRGSDNREVSFERRITDDPEQIAVRLVVEGQEVTFTPREASWAAKMLGSHALTALIESGRNARELEMLDRDLNPELFALDLEERDPANWLREELAPFIEAVRFALVKGDEQLRRALALVAFDMGELLQLSSRAIASYRVCSSRRPRYRPEEDSSADRHKTGPAPCASRSEWLRALYVLSMHKDETGGLSTKRPFSTAREILSAHMAGTDRSAEVA